MIAIVNDRFDPPFGFRSSGGLIWKTEILTRASGVETRNALWARPLRKWQVTGVPLTQSSAIQLTRFFNARSGAAQGFRFRDPFGASSAHSGGHVTPLDQRIGTGDGAQTGFRLQLDDGAAIALPVTRPVPASVRLAADGVETSDFTVNESTGEIAFASPPAPGAVLTAGFEFDLPVRFETDRLDLSQTSKGAFQLVQLSLLELREIVA